MKVRSFKNQEANRISARRLMRVSKKEGEANRRTLASVNRCIDKKLAQDMGSSTDMYTQSGRVRVEFVGKSRRHQTFEDDIDCDDLYQNPACDNEDHGYDRTDGFIVDDDCPAVYGSDDDDEEVLSYGTDDSDYDSEASDEA
jgi:hypothetical protein